MSDTIEKPSEKPSEKQTAKRSNDRPSREYVAEFVDENTRIGVRVQRTQSFRPYYSITIGRFVPHDDGESFVPYVPVRTEVEFAKLKSIQNHSALIGNLVKDATEWIAKKIQEREDEIIAQQQARESRRDFQDKTKPGLKTLSKIDRVTKGYVVPDAPPTKK